MEIQHLNGKRVEVAEPVDDHTRVRREITGVGSSARVTVRCETCGTGPTPEALRRETCLEARTAADIMRNGDRGERDGWQWRDKAAREVYARTTEAGRRQ